MCGSRATVPPPVPCVPPLAEWRPASLRAGGDATGLMTGYQSSAFTSASPCCLTCSTLARFHTGNNAQLCTLCACRVRIMLLTPSELDGFTDGGHYVDVSASWLGHACHATDTPPSRWQPCSLAQICCVWKKALAKVRGSLFPPNREKVFSSPAWGWRCVTFLKKLEVRLPILQPNPQTGFHWKTHFMFFLQSF